MSDNDQMFNEHQADARNRADSLAKAIFLLAGGSLTISISLFNNNTAPELTPLSEIILKLSWALLTVSIVSLVLMLSIILLRDYAFGERWRKSLNGNKEVDTTNNPTWVETLILVMAISGILTFIAGMVTQTYVAITII